MAKKRLIQCADCSVRFDPVQTGFYSEGFGYGLCDECEYAQSIAMSSVQDFNLDRIGETNEYSTIERTSRLSEE
jgi:hypothetical protein